jgi:glycosyltransferase involved in cell wall biosynthesis
MLYQTERVPVRIHPRIDLASKHPPRARIVKRGTTPPIFETLHGATRPSLATSESPTKAEAVAVDSRESIALPPKLSIVVPAFNEATRIGDSLRRIKEFVNTVPFQTELIVVDDGSRDETSNIVTGLQFPGLRLIRDAENHGKGHAVTLGVLAAVGEYVLFSDADLSAPIEEFKKLLAAAVAENADVVIGSRGVDRSVIERHQSPAREMGGVIFNKMVRLLLGLNIHDTQCGFKLFRREKTVPIFRKLTTAGFGFDAELLFLASRAGLKIREVPVRWSHSEGSKVRFLSDGVRMLTDLLRIRWNYLVADIHDRLIKPGRRSP